MSKGSRRNRIVRGHHKRQRAIKKLDSKVAVVTGASKGVGAAIADQLAADGACVVVNYARSRAGAEAVGARIREKGGKAIAVCALSKTSTGGGVPGKVVVNVF